MNLSAEHQPYVDCAINELLRPQLPTTLQHLEVMNFQTENELPEVVRIHEMDQAVSMYFSVENEKFFIVVDVLKFPELKPALTWIESGHRIYLTATSKNLSQKKMASGLSLKPLTGWSKDDLHVSTSSPRYFSRLTFDPFACMAYGLEEKLEALLTELEKDIEGVLLLSSKAKAYISVCRYQYISGNAGIQVSMNIINRLQRLNLPIDIDTYIVGKPLRDKDDGS